METKRGFSTIIPGHHYEVPVYEVIENKGIQPTGEMLPFTLVRGSKVDSENKVQPMAGSLHEHYLTAMIEDLKFKHAEFPSKETHLAIEKLEEARHWLEEREMVRAAAGVLGTYKPHKV